MSDKRQAWRLIDTGPGDGAANMAVDEALLNRFIPGWSAPVLRLYEWAPPALSLGRFQKREEVLDTARCAAAGVPIVQRITGGGVIYHGKELTYSLVCSPVHVPPAASIKDSFRVLTSFLLRFYQKLGLDAAYAVAHPSSDKTVLGTRTDFCFAGRESYDILVEGRKIGGNAQRRQREVIFQHGSIPLANEALRGASFLRHPPEAVDEVAGALADFRVRRRIADLKPLLVDAFRETIGGALLEDSLTDGEREDAAAGAARKA